MLKPLSYNEVKTYINSEYGNGCELVTTEAEFAEEKKISNVSPSYVTIRVKCKCGEIYITNYHYFRNGKKQCKKCGIQNRKDKNTYGYDEVKKFIEVESNSECKLITSLEDYKDANGEIKVMCKCGNVYTTSFTNFKTTNKRQCNKCSYEIRNEQKRLKIEEVITFIDGIDGNGCKFVEGEYKNNTTKLKIRCACGNIFSTSLAEFKGLNKKQCNECGKRIQLKDIKKTHEKFCNELNIIKNGTYTVLSDYVSVHTKILVKHSECGNTFYTEPARLLYTEKGCPYCAGNAKLTIQQVKKFIEVTSNSNYKLLSATYINNSTPLKICCDKGHEYETSYGNFYMGKRCPLCNEPKGEEKIDKFLSLHNLVYDTQYKIKDCRNKLPLPFDFAVFEDNEKTKLKCLIEFDGEQHFKVVDFYGGEEGYLKRIKNDEIKNKYCKDNNIRLIRIPYYDFNNIPEILLKELLNT